MLFKYYTFTYATTHGKARSRTCARHTRAREAGKLCYVLELYRARSGRLAAVASGNDASGNEVYQNCTYPLGAINIEVFSPCCINTTMCVAFVHYRFSELLRK